MSHERVRKSNRIFYLLLLVLRVFRNEKREALVDTTLLEELLKLLLEVKVEGFELTKTRQLQSKTRASARRRRKCWGRT